MDNNLFIKYKKKRIVIISFSVVILILLYMFKNTSFLIRSFSAIGLVVLFYMVDHFFDLDFHKKHYTFVVLISIFSFILSPLYFMYPNYDKVLHLIEPMMLASIVFHMVNKLDLKLKWKFVFVFFVVVGSLGLFEIGEYLLDTIFNFNLQGVYLRDLEGIAKLQIIIDPLDDTILDMSLGIFGAILHIIAVSIHFRKSMNRKTPNKQQ